MRKKTLINYWNNFYGDKKKFGESSFARFVLKKIKNKKNFKIIDIGCGNGRDSFFFSKKKFNVTGVDISSRAIKRNKIFKNKKIDGVDASGLILGKGKSPRKEFLHYSSRGVLEGIRLGQWKLLRKNHKNKKPAETIMLFNLMEDLGEQNNLAQEHPAIVAKLSSKMKQLDLEIEENAREPWYNK